MRITLVFSFLCCFYSFSQIDFIHVDQFGYAINSPKYAVLSDPQSGFNAGLSYTPSANLSVIEQVSGQVVFSGSPTLWNNGSTDNFSGDRGWHFNFSSVTTPGTYYISDLQNNIQSHPFEITASPYLNILKAASRMFYYNRCSTDKPALYAGTNWSDGLCFDNPLQDGQCRYIYDPTNVALQKDLSGGWFDAGDNNKYVTFAASVVHDLIEAYVSNPSVFGDDWNIPESGNGIPDILDELKWELDWLIKMTNSDGSVHLKMGNQNYSQNSSSPPSANTDPRFYSPTCTSASAAVASMLSHAAVLFDTIPLLQVYASTLATTAENSFNYTLPFFNSGTLETDCDDGSIVSGDADQSIEEQRNSLIIASLYLYEFTGNSTYEQFFIANSILTDPLFNDYWDAYHMPLNDALLHYKTLPNPDNSLIAEINNSITSAVNNNWNNYFGMNNLTLYRDYIPTWSYHWGSNRPKANFGNLNLLVADYPVNLNSASQRQRALEILHSFHGVNPLNLVYLSNMYTFGAEQSVNEIYHFWFNDQTDYDNALTSLYGPAPGYVVGGPNRNFSVNSLTPPYNQPDTKSYLDYNAGYPLNSWEVSEPAIYYQSAYIRLLAGIMKQYDQPSNGINETENASAWFIVPNPATDYLEIKGISPSAQTQLLNAMGTEILESTSNTSIDISKLNSGVYFIRIIEDGKNRGVQKFIKQE